MADVTVPQATITALLALVEAWRDKAIELEGDREENESWRDEADDDMAGVYEECASKLMFLIAPLDPQLDTETSASRQHFIDTGNYLTKAEV